MMRCANEHRIVRIFDAVKQDREFVAAQARHEVARFQARRDARADFVAAARRR